MLQDSLFKNSYFKYLQYSFFTHKKKVIFNKLNLINYFSEDVILIE
tara:strand:- start:911 stop:1048 length:138 start_codon:yes stop_codon:yes gene_type:complete